MLVIKYLPADADIDIFFGGARHRLGDAVEIAHVKEEMAIIMADEQLRRYFLNISDDADIGQHFAETVIDGVDDCGNCKRRDSSRQHFSDVVISNYIAFDCKRSIKLADERIIKGGDGSGLEPDEAVALVDGKFEIGRNLHRLFDF